MTRTILLAVTVLGILSLIGLDFGDYLANEPAYTVGSFEIYRIVLSVFVDNSIISVVFMWLFFPAMGARMEQQMGTASFGWLLLSSAIAINVGFLVVCLFLAMFGMSSAMHYICSGFWSVLFTLISLDCLATPDMPRRLLCIPVDIPGQYFPFAIYAFFCFFGGFRLDLLLGIGVGYGYSHGYLDRLKPTEGYLEGLEACEGGIIYNTARNNEGYIFVQNASYDPVAMGMGSDGGGNSAQNQQNNSGMPGGFSNMGGFGGGGGAAPVAEAVPVDAFPGQGAKLSNVGVQSVSKQEVKAQRLAALAGQSSYQV
jgi:membrane associated rhomboid family serine protease